MRAVIADHPGAPDVLHPITLADPEPGPEQVRVAVEVAAITFIDTLIRAGSPVAPPATFPIVLGNGVGGVVDRVGPGVDPAWIGARVVTTTGGAGGYASLALARIADLHRVPEALGLPEATALLADGRTALGLHLAASIRRGETVVITAAAGGVGSILVQLATASGAHVIALAGSTDKLDHALRLGADTAVLYRDHDWTSRLGAAAPNGADVVFDGIGADTTPALFALVRPGGRYVQHGAAGGSWGTIAPATAADRNITVIPLATIGTPAELFSFTERALDLAAQGTIRPTIGQTFPLDDAAAAHAAIGSRTTTGKTLLIP
ncbi:zinc-binding dehydrogenase [Microbacterium lushaniae]|nr:zinc-binding dehydrogenase [Microbacterium lushaniae]KAA9149524.1 zinc-binding dehydrogenase [Microbacterium lushaniae]